MVIKSFEIEQTHVLWLQQIEKRLVKQCRQSIVNIVKVLQKKISSLAFMVATFSNLSRFYTMTIKRCFVTYLCVRHGILLFF